MFSIIGHIIFYIVLALGVLLTTLGLFGTWIILAASIVYGWATGFAQVTWQILGMLAVIAMILEVVEFLLAVKLAEKLGAGKKASWAAVVGAILGGIGGTAILPIIGSLVGALAGAFLGAVSWEMSQGKSVEEAALAGRGALLGKGGAIIAKTVGAIIMVTIVITV